jgi:hypothetical protein
MACHWHLTNLEGPVVQQSCLNHICSSHRRRVYLNHICSSRRRRVYLYIFGWVCSTPKFNFREIHRAFCFTEVYPIFSRGSPNLQGRISLFGGILYFNTNFGRPFWGVRPWVECITRSGSALSFHLTRHPSSGNAQGSYPQRIYDVCTEESRYPLYSYLRRCSASRVNRAALFSVALSLPVEAFSCAHEQTRATISSSHHICNSTD